MSIALKKILFIIPSLRAGGAERITSIYATHLDRKKYEIVVAVVNGKDPFFELPSDVKIIDLKKKSVTAATLSIVRSINNERPNIVISMITHLNALVGACSPLYRSKPKLILRETNVLSNLFGDAMSFKRKMRYKITKFGYGRADSILCQSHFMAKDVQSNLGIPKQNCVVIHNPVAPAKSDGSIEKFDLVALGNLSPIKGYERLINVMHRLKDTKLKLAIIGEGSERNKIENQIKTMDLEQQVILLGFQKEPHRYLMGAKALVMTSIKESFSNAVLEAGIVGTPTVTYNMPGGMSEIIENGVNGYIVDDGDEVALSNAIKNIITDPIDRASITKYTEERFTLNTIMSQVENRLL